MDNLRLFLLSLSSLFLVDGAVAEDRPNILFCMADDWGWPHAGAYGDEEIQTPAFDRIAREGVLFHHTYVSSPSCTPSRNAVITGKYHWQLGPGANLWSTLPTEHESFIHLLEDSGYTIGRDIPKTWGPGKIESWQQHHGEHPAGPKFDGLTEFLEKRSDSNTPFFFWLATSDPHRGYERDSGINSGINPDKVHLFPHFPDTAPVRRDIADYYFEVQRWDRKVADALALLEERKLLENTIVIMTGDHGMPFPRCKGNLYDSGTRVPFAVRWGKGIPPNRQVEDFVSLTDVAPTLLQAAGIPPRHDMSGDSFLSLLTSEKSGQLDPRGRPYVVTGRERHTPAQAAPDMAGYPARAIRTPDFLFIRNYRPDRWPAGVSGEDTETNRPNQWYSDCDGGPTKDEIIGKRDQGARFQRAYELCFAQRPTRELYDLKQDPDQLENLADDPAHRDTIERLEGELKQRLLQLKDPRAKEPDYKGFDPHPYYGSGGGKKNRKKKAK